jgi:hypothetical protein
MRCSAPPIRLPGKNWTPCWTGRRLPARGGIRWLARTLVAAAAILGLVLAIRQTLLPGDPPAAWTSQEIRDIPPGYFAHYLAAAHELAGYRPVGEGGDSGFGASHPLDHSPVTE